MRRSAVPVLVALLLLLPGMVLLSRDFGVTYDERFQQKYGEELWDYVHGRRTRAAFDAAPAHQNLYGGSFELTAVATQHAFPRANVYVTRHAVNAVFGWPAIVFCWLTARKLFGEFPGALAALLLVLTPRFLAHSMNNPKDVPFAAFAAAVMYLVVTVRREPPFMSWSHALKLGIAIGLALSVRPVALLFVVYLALLLGWYMVAARGALDRQNLVAMGARGVVLIMVALALGVSAWPWAQANPLVRPVQAFLELSRFEYGGVVLFRGESHFASELPASYIPTWLAIGFPPVLLAGALLSLLGLARSATRRTTVILWAFFLLPLVLAIVRRSTLYDEIRHFTFVLPALAVLSAAGWGALITTGRSTRRTIASVVLLGALAEPLWFIIRNHPNEIAYFSPVMGGPRAAFGRYDMDYWGNCMFEAVRWSGERAREAGGPVGLWGVPEHLVVLNAERFKTLYFSPQRSWQHHLQIHLLRGPRESVVDFATRPDLVHRIETSDGAPLCVILSGPTYPAIASRITATAR